MTIHLKKPWIRSHVQHLHSEGSWTVSKQSPSLIIDWYRVPGKSDRINVLLCEAHKILVSTYTNMELEFAQAYPETIKSEMFLKPLIPLLEHPQIDWEKAREILYSSFDAFFRQTDFSQFAGENDEGIIFIARDPQTKTVVGIMQALVTPEYRDGEIKIGMYAVKDSPQVLKTLMSHLFVLFPQIKRIFLHTRCSHKEAFKLYESLGFMPHEGPLPYWSDWEYRAEKMHTLQKHADLC